MMFDIPFKNDVRSLAAPGGTMFISRPLRPLLISLAVLSLLVVLRTSAQQPAAPPQKLAVVDTERILLTSQLGKKALEDLKKLQSQKENELKVKGEGLLALQKQFSDGQATLGADQRASLQRQLQEGKTELDRMREDATRELNKKRDDVLAGIDQKVMPVINQVGKELGYGMIFRKFESGLIYADDGLDITNAVIQRLDKTKTAG